MFEYMPTWVQVPRDQFFLPTAATNAAMPSLAVQVTPGRQAPQSRAFSVAAAAPWTFSLHQFYFPGWEAVIDGHPVAAQPAGALALAAVTVPAGQHQVVFRFGSTPLRQIGWALTLAAAALCLVLAVWTRRWRWLIGAAVLAALCVGVWSYERYVSPSDIWPTAANADFGGQIKLIGFHAPAGQIRPAQANAVDLQWLALRTPSTNYKVFLHLTDSTGKLWAQHDGEPGYFFSPTTRWQAGEIVDDQHILSWIGKPPPGHYQLRAGLYDPATGARLPLIGLNGQASGDQVLLTEFDIAP
jgi:hypothetical protein